MGLGSTLGKLAGKAVATGQEINQYKSQYQHMNDEELIVEYKALKLKNSTEYRLRANAIRLILKDRGYE